MKVVLRDPPLPVLLMAIVVNIPVRKAERAPKKAPGWATRRLTRFIEKRDELSRKAG